MCIKNCETKRSLKVYISGAIACDKNYYSNFEAAENQLLAKKYVILSPIRTTAHNMHKGIKECFLESLKMLFNADIMVQISPVEISKGMQIEKQIADYLDVPIQNWVLQNKNSEVKK